MIRQEAARGDGSRVSFPGREERAQCKRNITRKLCFDTADKEWLGGQGSLGRARRATLRLSWPNRRRSRRILHTISINKRIADAEQRQKERANGARDYPP